MLHQLRATFITRNQTPNPVLPVVSFASSSTNPGTGPLLGYSVAARRRLRAIFKNTVKRVCHLLRIRRRWAAVGQALQQPAVHDLFKGLSRVRGVLRRTLRQ